MEQTGIILASPAIESLLFKLKDSNWPNWIKDNQTIKIESKIRLDLCRQLNSLFRNGYTSSDMTSVYNNLSDFIEASNFNQRLILYLPTELIPENPKNIELAASRFQTIYLHSWRNLLYNYDLRANFLDGDTEQSDMVSKAAHLIPILLKKGLISFKEIIDLFENSSDKILSDSILDTLPTIFELELASSTDLDLLSDSENYWLHNLAIIIKSNGYYKPEPVIINNKTDLEKLIIVIDQKIIEKNKLIKSQTEDLDRINWRQQKEQKIIFKKYANDVYCSLMNKTLIMADFKSFLFSQTNELSIILGIYTLGKINSLKVSREFKSWLIEVSQKSNLILDTIESTLSYWFNQGAITQKYLEHFFLAPKQIDANFSNKKIMSDSELKEMSGLIKLIEEDVELSRYLYPVLIIYGSRIKGYASKTTDIDLAVFVRSEVDFKYFDYLNERLKKIMKHEKIKGQPLQFWLKNDHENLLINDAVSYQKVVGNSYYVHVLLGGAWLGNKKIITELHAKLLPKYLTDNSYLKTIWLKELERDFLQYRLMHSGYTNFFPERKILDTLHSSDIDSSSSFWDEGYRELATKLFIKKIFLPTII
jgi:predicted nucleotidyltransferase